MQLKPFSYFRACLNRTLCSFVLCAGLGFAQGTLDLTYSGNDGTLDYQWIQPAIGSTNSLGIIHVNANFLQSQNCQFDLALTVDQTTAPLQLQNIAAVGDSDSNRYQLTFTAGGATVNMIVRPKLAGKTLKVHLKGDTASIAAVRLSGWPTSLHGQPIAVPYYSEEPIYFSAYGIFGNSYFDWQHSNATLLNASQAVYSPRTDGTRNLVREELVISMGQDFADVLPHIANPKSPYKKQLAGRTVVDIWQGDFEQIAQGLKTLSDYGVRNCVVLIHDWQRSGYDNALPSHFPANAAKGGDAAMMDAVAAGQSAGCYVGLHENYLDYYPNYDYFTTDAIARNSDNSLRFSWFNTTTGIQSYATKPTWMLPNANTQAPQIQGTYQTDAAFIDVNSAVVPWGRPDMDATQKDAGSLSAFSNGSIDLWNLERTTHSGPVLGEGAAHWFWSGLLDGVEAQLGVGVSGNISTKVPLFVDFDLLAIHPKQVNHGMGYYERWVAPGESITTTALLDAYRMQEVAYGHAPFIGNVFRNSVSRVLLEQNLVGPVAARYGLSKAKTIQYQVNGQWTNTDAAIAAGDWSRVHVKYKNGDEVVANSQSTSLKWNGYQIPQYGWLAQGKNLLAYTAVRSGQIVDYAQTSDFYFANARNALDLAISDSTAIAQPSAVKFQQTASGKAQITVQWAVLNTMPSVSLKNFVHFVNPLQTANAGIVFGADHFPTIPTNQWQQGQSVQDTFSVTVPPYVPDGTYSMRIGLYSTQDGSRYPLLGNDDHTYDRYIVGNLTSSQNGAVLSFQIVPFATADSRLNANGSVVDFGTMQTDGMVSITQDGANWVLRAYPRNRNVVVNLSSATLPIPATVTCDSGSVLTSQQPTLSGGLWSINTNGQKTCSWPLPASKKNAQNVADSGDDDDQ